MSRTASVRVFLGFKFFAKDVKTPKPDPNLCYRCNADYSGDGFEHCPKCGKELGNDPDKVDFDYLVQDGELYEKDPVAELWHPYEADHAWLYHKKAYWYQWTDHHSTKLINIPPDGTMESFATELREAAKRIGIKASKPKLHFSVEQS